MEIWHTQNVRTDGETGGMSDGQTDKLKATSPRYKGIMMTAIGVDPKIVNIIQALYIDTEYAVVIDGYLTEWFSVNVGLGHG